MTKFKFGDKVWHDEFGVCIYHHSLGYKNMCRVITERDGSKKVSENNITKVSDWIQCSERMPEFNVRVFVINKLGGIKTDYLLGLYDNGSPDWGDYENYTYWMPLPDMPEVKE